MRNKLPLFWVKVFYYEYWPFWLFFLPLVPYWLYLALRARSLTYFTAANPGIEHSGVFGESKIDILRKIDPKYLPITLFFHAGTDWMNVLEEMGEAGLKFPVIIKPNVGERGSQVEKLENLEGLKSYLENNSESFIIQEFVSYPVELGVFYYRIPGTQERGINSLVMKDFLTVEGDGMSTIRQLILKNERAHLQLESLEFKLGDQLSDILPKGELRLLQPIGNHCLGTKFLSGQHLINEQMVQVFDQIASTIEGFNIGRFDLKVTSLEDLMQRKNIKIMELNGVTSEPAHIYDPKYNLYQAYRDTSKTMKIMYRVSQQNRKLGAKVTPVLEMLKLIRNHFSKKSEVNKIRSSKSLSLPNALGSIQ